MSLGDKLPSLRDLYSSRFLPEVDMIRRMSENHCGNLRVRFDYNGNSTEADLGFTVWGTKTVNIINEGNSGTDISHFDPSS
jgi:hypothetical protein